MDKQLQELKRKHVRDPGDSIASQRYIAALERVVGGVQAAKEPPKRPGWNCPPEYQKWMSSTEGTVLDPNAPASPDGICVYDSDSGKGEHQGRRTVRLMIDGDWVDHLLPEDYTGYDDGESDDWCIFCGHPDERK